MQILKRRSFFLVLFLSIGCSKYACTQDVYQIKQSNEQKYVLGGASLLLLSAYQREKTNPPNLDFIQALSSDNIPTFDRGATLNLSTKADHYSDIGIYASLCLPASLYLLPKVNKKQATILWGEAVILTAGATLLCKYIVRRPRPYMYNPSVMPTEKMKRHGLTSFFSGHTSLTAVNSFYAAKVFNDHYPEKPIKYLVWTLAAAWPAFTGYMRVKSGNHFRSDVMTGYAVGAAFGILIPHLHKNKEVSSAWNVSGSADGICLSYDLSR